jgi:ribosomal protein L37E
MRKKIIYECQRCGAKHYEGEFSSCCDFDDMGGNDR